jgi:iron(III) transport system substrate-binding protein
MKQIEKKSGARAIGAAAASAAAVMAAIALAAAGILSACSRSSAGDGGSGSPADLVVYTSHSEEMARAVISEFRGRTGLSVRLVQGGTVEILKRVRSESADAGRRRSSEGPGTGERCDVMWGGGAETLWANSELFERYVSPEAEAIAPEYKASDGSWTGFTILPMAICYNSRLLSADRAPKSWKELLEPRFKGAIAYADPRVSASSYTILRTIGTAVSSATGSSRASVEASFIRNLGGKLLPESGDVFPSVASGEYLVGLYIDQGASEYMLPGSDLKIVYPSDGTSAAPDGVALAKGALHPATARRFIDFVLGRDVAMIMSSRFQRRSVRSDCPPPPGQLPLSAIKLVPHDIALAAREKDETLARFSASFPGSALP